MKQTIRIAASLAVSAVFLWIAARGVSWSEVGEALGRARLVWILPMFGAAVASLGFRALRWRVFLRPIRDVPLHSVFSASCIGFAGNMLLPLRAGEVIRPWVLARREGVPFAGGMATIAVERLFDMATLLLMFGVATLTLPLPEEWRRYGWLFLVTFVGFLGFLAALRRAPETVIGWIEWLLTPFPAAVATRVVDASRGFVQGLGSLASAGAIAEASLWSAGVWLSLVVCFGTGLSAFALDVPWFRAAVAATTFVAIAVSIPGGPGFVGMFQVGCTVALAVFDVPKSLGLAYSVLEHVVQFASSVLLGIYYFLRQGFDLAEIRRLEAGEAPIDDERGTDAGAPR